MIILLVCVCVCKCVSVYVSVSVCVRVCVDISLIIHRGMAEDTELVDGLVLDLKASHVAGGVTRVEKAKIGLIQFCISPPKTDVSKMHDVSMCVQPSLSACLDGESGDCIGLFSNGLNITRGASIHS